MANGNVDVESDILILWSRIKMPLSAKESSHNLSLYCYLAQLLNVGEQSSRPLSPWSLTLQVVQAETIVLSANSDESENIDRKNAKYKLERDLKDLKANGSLDVNEVKCFR